MYYDVSGDSLYEFDILSEQLTLLKDSSHIVSSAVYFHKNDNKIIYYKYGDPLGIEPGYYLYDKFLDQDILLFSYISPSGPTELVNGLDFHPNNDRILIPICRSTLLEAITPMLGEFSFGSNRIDTLSIEFDLSLVRIGVWGRYNQDGTQILYCVYPKGANTETTNDNSEVGIIDYLFLEKKILDVNTNPNGKSVQIAPNWNNDFQSIVFGSGRLTLEGTAGRRGLYTPKQLN